MALMTGEQYIESIKKIKMEIYMFGEKSQQSHRKPHSASLPQFRAHDL